jgi:hypothetical protein
MWTSTLQRLARPKQVMWASLLFSKRYAKASEIRQTAKSGQQKRKEPNLKIA